MTEKEKLNLYIREFKKAYLKGKLSLEDAHDYALTYTYNEIKRQSKS